MKFQDYVIDSLRHSFEEAFKNAKHVKPDKVAWQPCDEGRSVLNICQELAKCPDWANTMLVDRKTPEHSEETMNEYLKEREPWTTVDICYKVGKAKLENLISTINSFPDEDLKKTIWMPYDGGRDFDMTEIMSYPLWNYQYHHGQIAYIETLYGDKDMG